MADNLDHRIKERAYQLWVQEGRPHGRDLEHWLQAERTLGASAEAAGNPSQKAAATPRKRAARPRKTPASAPPHPE
jgi:hypothetical protein